MSTSVYERLGFNYSGTAIKDLSQNVVQSLSVMPPILKPWQKQALAIGDTDSYTYNPVANLANTIILSCQNVYNASNNSSSLMTIYTLANTIYSNSANLFLDHTDRISGVKTLTPDEAGADSKKPHLDSAMLLGKNMMYLTYQTDGVINNSPILGSFTSVLCKDDLQIYSQTMSTYANNVINSITVVGPDGLGNYANTTNLSAGTITIIENFMTSLNTFLDTRRLHDYNFYANCQVILNDFSKLNRFSQVGETENILYNNYIGTEKLKVVLKSPDSVYTTEGAPIPSANASTPKILSAKIYKPENSTDFRIEIRYEGLIDWIGDFIYGSWDSDRSKILNNNAGYEVIYKLIESPYGVIDMAFSMPSNDGPLAWSKQPFVGISIRKDNFYNIVLPNDANCILAPITLNTVAWPKEIISTKDVYGNYNYTPPPSPVGIPTETDPRANRWLSEFRLQAPISMTSGQIRWPTLTNAQMNFNWLADNYGQSWAQSYAANVPSTISSMWKVVDLELRRKYGDIEADRIAITYTKGGNQWNTNTPSQTLVPFNSTVFVDSSGMGVISAMGYFITDNTKSPNEWQLIQKNCSIYLPYPINDVLNGPGTPIIQPEIPAGTLIKEMPWPGKKAFTPRQSGLVQFSQEIVAFKFTTSNESCLVRLSFAEFEDAPIYRLATLSPFAGVLPKFDSNTNSFVEDKSNIIRSVGGVGSSVYFTVGNPPKSFVDRIVKNYGRYDSSIYPVLKPNTTYYFNIVNRNEYNVPNVSPDVRPQLLFEIARIQEFEGEVSYTDDSTIFSSTPIISSSTNNLTDSLTNQSTNPISITSIPNVSVQSRNKKEGTAAANLQRALTAWNSLPDNQDARDAFLLGMNSTTYNALIGAGIVTQQDVKNADARWGGRAGLDDVTGRPWVSYDGETRTYF